VNWDRFAGEVTKTSDPGRVGSDGAGSGTPMQVGGERTRTVTWGSGYGRFNQFIADVPRPADGGRYWVTAWPALQFDKRCIITSPHGAVHELIQFDQDVGRLSPPLPQQALNLGSWRDGELVHGVAVTAAGLPGHGYIWGPGSAANPHVQAMTVPDYHGGDGSKVGAEGAPAGTGDPNAPFAIPEGSLTCGDWYVLTRDSSSYRRMILAGGECAARAEAMADKGVRLIDRGRTISVLTQAGRWARATNISRFTVALDDLRLAS